MNSIPSVSQSSNKPLRGDEKCYQIALIGVGHRGYKTHFLNAHGSRSESIIAVCDAHEGTLKSFSEKHPDIPAYSNVDQLLQNHKPDFAIVCIPHKFHFGVISQLAAAGVPVLKEKPAAESLEEFQQLCNLPIPIGVTFQKRFEPRFIQFEKLLSLVGEIASFKATLAMNIENLESTWRAGDGVGVTEDLGCHMLDLVVWLFGTPSSVTAHQVDSVRRFQKYGGDDVSHTILRWDSSNVIGHVHLSRVAHKAEESIVVTGTSGTLVLDGNKITLLSAGDGTQMFEMVDSSTKKSVMRSMLRQFGDFASGRTSDFAGSLKNLGSTVAIMDATRRSFNSHQAESLDSMPSTTVVASLDGEHHVWPLITPETVDSVVKQMHSSLSIYNRSNVYETFEDRWRTMHGMKHALVCSSGTIAIYHMFEALDLRPGDEVLCPVYTFFATATPMLQYGAIPVFCDALPDGNLDPAEILKKSTSKTRAVIVTHMWGLPCDMPTIVANAQKKGIKVLEDCSHAHGAVVAGKIVGSWGDMSAWSLQAKKNITGGQAGVMATNSTDYYARAITHGHFNKRAKQEVPESHPFRKFWLTGLGLNLRAHPLAIAMANHQLDLHPSWVAHREKYARHLTKRLSTIPFLRMPKVANEKTDKHAWYAFVMQFDPSKAPKGLTREKYVEALEKRGLKEVDIPRSTGLLNDLPLFTHTHEAIPRYGSEPWYPAQKGFPGAQAFFDGAIKLPVWSTPGDWKIVQHYADTFVEVAEEFMKTKAEKKKAPEPQPQRHMDVRVRL